MTFTTRFRRSILDGIRFTSWILLVLYALEVSTPALMIAGGYLSGVVASIVFFNPRVQTTDLIMRVIVLTCTVALVGVSLQSRINLIAQVLTVVVGAGAATAIIAMKSLHTTEGPGALLMTTLVVTSLLIQGWLFLSPLALGLLLSVAVRKISRTGFANAVIAVVLVSTAQLSRTTVGDEMSRFFVTYDQLYRASLGVSLTRWGWTDWNALAGTGIRYHWLSEAVSGWIARVAGIDPFFVIAAVWPTILTFGAIAALTTALKVWGAGSVSTVTAFIVVGFSYFFEFSSVGTMLGAVLMIAVVGMVGRLFPARTLSILDVRHLVYIALLLALAPMAQSTTGILAIGVAAGISIKLILQPHKLRWPFAAVTAAGLATSVLYSQTLLKAGGYGLVRTSVSVSTSLPALLPDFLQSVDPFPGFQETANLWWLIFGAVAFSMLTKFMPSAISGSAVLWSAAVTTGAFVSSVRIGGFEARMLGELGLLVTILLLAKLLQLLNMFRFGLLTICIVLFVATSWRLLGTSIIGMEWTQRIEILTPVWFGVLLSLLAVLGLVSIAGRVIVVRNITLAMMAVFLLIGGGIQSQRRLDLMTRAAFDVTAVLRGPQTQACLSWIRNNTEKNTVVASNMWRLPNSDVQKFYLVSTYSERRSLIDGTEYVTYAGMRDRGEIEYLKNLIDASVERPSIPLLRELTSRGASYLIVDRTRTPLSRVDWFTETMVATPECSVHRLPSLT